MGASYGSYNLISKYITLFHNIVDDVGCGRPVSGARGSCIKQAIWQSVKKNQKLCDIFSVDCAIR